MKQIIIVILCVLNLQVLYAQKQDYIWPLGIDWGLEEGIQAYRFDFNSSPFEVQEVDQAFEFRGNNGAICDPDGKLLLYTNGCLIADGNHNILFDSLVLNEGEIKTQAIGDTDGYVGSQDLMLFPLDSVDSCFILIHKQRVLSSEGSIEVFLNQSSFCIGESNVLIDSNLKVEGAPYVLASFLTGITQHNSTNWWIVQPLSNDSLIMILQLDENGLSVDHYDNASVYFHADEISAAGTAKFSPDGTKYAIYNEHNGLSLYDFDRTNGTLTHKQTIRIVEDSSFARFFGVEWSPNSRFLYTASSTELHQVDTWEEDLTDGVRLVDVYNGTQDPFNTTFFLMSLGPDCRIYMCPTSSTFSYHVINSPDELGTACDFVQNGIQLPRSSGVASFPNYPRFRVDEEDKCDPTIVSIFGEQVHYTRSLQAYPSPTTGTVTIQLPSQLAKAADIYITSTDGTVLSQQCMDAGESTSTISLTSYPTGMYTISLVPQDKDNIVYSTKVSKI